jgi:hypothetical protein
MVLTSKRKESTQASANYMIRGAVTNRGRTNKSAQKDGVVGRLKDNVKGVKNKVVSTAGKTTASANRKSRSMTKDRTINRDRKYEGSTGTDLPK